jgi:hypothetical protein
MTKRNPGRPRLGRSATARVELKIPEADRKRWLVAADKRGLTLSELVRESVETCIARGSSR